jgi:hypothetical protein
MAERRSSLLDDAGLNEKAAPQKAKSGGSDKIKLLIAVGIFALAALVYLYTSGNFGGTPAPKYVPPSPEEQQAHQELQKRNEQMIKSGKATTGGE